MTLIDLLRIGTVVFMTPVGIVTLLSVTYCLWLLAAAEFGILFKRKPYGDLLPITRFCVLIPAHDEELVIARTLAATQKLDYPAHLLTIVAIADNCTDRTTEIIRKYPDVVLLERRNDAERGKGFALNWALERLTPEREIDTFVVIDADTDIDSDFLRKMDSRRQASKSKNFVAQGRYDVLNPEESWRTALMAGALSLVHDVRPLARETLGLTVGLKGNGMAFDRSVLRDAPWRGGSLTEDIDHTLDLLERLNIRVAYVPDARVAAVMPSTSVGAVSQRQRWENGRTSILRQRSFSLLMKGLTRFNPVYIDAAFDLLVPPLAEMAALLTGWIVLIGLLAAEGGPWKLPGLLALYCVIGLGAYVAGGFAVAKAPSLAYRALVYAPFYTVWKLFVRLSRSAGDSGAWVRTTREQALEESVPCVSETNTDVLAGRLDERNRVN